MSRYGLLGEKLGHSLSPQIHNHILQYLGMEQGYDLLEVPPEKLPWEIERLKKEGVRGVNVTIPYKETVMPLLDEISPEAQAIGAVNVIDFREGCLVGYNTDYFGFSAMLRLAGISVQGKQVVQLGAGGAAKACIAALHDLGAASILVANRTGDKLAELRERFPFLSTCLLEDTEALQGDILVNCTPVGMYPKVEGCPVSREVICRFEAVADVVYNPLDTLLVSTAKELGLTASSGLNMLVYQAMKAQEIWQGSALPESLGEAIYQELSALF